MAKRPPRIVISRLSAHGDVIQTIPLLAAIKRMFPEAVVGWIVEPSAAPLLVDHPLIDTLHIYPLKRWLKQLRHPTQWLSTAQEAQHFFQQIRAQHYTYGFDVQGLLKSASVLFFAGVPNRAGYKGTREFADFFYTTTLPYHELKNPHIPTVYKFMEFIHLLTPLVEGGKPKMPRVHYPLPPVSPVRREKSQRWLERLPHRPITIALAPSTVWNSKHWPMSSWAHLLSQLLALPSVRCVLIAAPSDAPKIQQLISQLPKALRYTETLLNLTGETELADLYALFQEVDLLIGLDSAPLHIANAVSANTGKPQILGLYGPTSPQRTGPINIAISHQTLTLSLPCQPCFEKTCPLESGACLKDLSVDRVYQKVVQLITDQPGASVSEKAPISGYAYLS